MKSNSRRKTKAAVLHWLSYIPGKRAACSNTSGYTTFDPYEVNCRRCLKLMDKYDIESI